MLPIALPFRSLLVALVAWATVLAVSPSPLQAGAEVDYDDSVDFSVYRTFRWQGGGRVSRQDRSLGKISPLVEKDIQRAVESQLEAKDLKPIASGRPDLAVVFRAGSHREVAGYGWGPGYRGPRGVRVFREGSLVIDLIDHQKRELVWRGWISANLKQKPEKLKKQIDKWVAKIFKNYPPP